MTLDSPPVDLRSRDDVAAQVRRLLGQSIPGWPQQSNGAAADGLISVFSQFCGIVINRLNRAPRKNFLAFLDMLGVSLLPPEAARVPLQFHLAAQQDAPVSVPAGTQVAAAQQKGEDQPVVFETERDLLVTPAILQIVAVKDGLSDTFADSSRILIEPVEDGVAAFQGSRPIPHHLYIALPLPFPPPPVGKAQLAVELEGAAPVPEGDWLEWEIWNGDAAPVTPIKPISDTTQQLRRSGEIDFEFPGLPAQTEVLARKGYWLRCRAIRGLPAGSPVPLVRAVKVRILAAQEKLTVDAVVVNAAPVDATKDIFPFGQQPAFNDAVYIASAAAFSKAGAMVTLQIQHTALPEVRPSGAAPRFAAIVWELWDGVRWQPAGRSESTGAATGDAAVFGDTTHALTKSGEVRLRMPDTPTPLNLAGVTSYWIRARLVGGDYGRPPHFVKSDKGQPELVPESFAPPIISTIEIAYTLRIDAPPRAIVTYNDFAYDSPDPSAPGWRPFLPSAEAASYCYFGFDPSKPLTAPSMTIYFGVGTPGDRKATLAMATAPPATLVWEYWTGTAWVPRTPLDETDGLRRSGLVVLLPPPGLALRNEFGISAYWARMKTRKDPGYQPRLRLAALNTTFASHSLTHKDEVLGSSNGSADQRFRTLKAPILRGQQLEVLEPGIPSSDSQRSIRAEEGDDAIRPTAPSDLRGPGFWVRWHEVPNFNGSGTRDRHYVLERETGEVFFGDGTNGRVPPAGAKNIVMTNYRTGGGACGNRPRHTIEELKTAIPYVDRATNPEPSGGGSDAESTDHLLWRAPRELRHGFRAVSAQDYEDLAVLASPEVARARAVPLFDLAADPDARQPHAGVVSLILAPVSQRSGGPVERPMPSVELIRRVSDYLDARRTREATLVIVGPEYVAIQVEAEVTITDPDRASAIERDIADALGRFLHPSLGRFDGAGWTFGQEPAVSELYAVIEGVPGVDHVRELVVSRVEDRPGAHRAGYFLVCGAEPRIHVTLDK